MKISVIGAGNVGGLAAMRLAEANFGDIVLIDALKGLAQGKAFDVEDASCVYRCSQNIKGSDDIKEIKDSTVVVITAGLARKPGMTREDLLLKNSQILKSLSQSIRELAKEAIVVVVTNPLDLMTYFVLKSTGFQANRVIGMGISLDSARFTNLISKELNIPNSQIEACVIGTHGEGMLPLSRFTQVKGITLDEFVDEAKVDELVKKTVGRGAEIVSLLGTGSAFFAPSQAITALVKAVLKDEKRIIGVSAYLNKEYGLKDVCIGVPCRIGKNGIEEIIELDLNEREKAALYKSTVPLKEQLKLLSI